MKKLLVFLLFFVLTVSSFADEPPNDYLYIEGNAIKADQLEFFKTNFGIEAVGAGYIVAETRAQAAYTFRFNIVLNMVTDDNGVSRPAQPGESQYAMRISLIDNTAQEELLFFFFYFTELEEAYEYTQFLFQRATLYIPPSSRTGGILAIDTSWQNKWLYLRLSFDYPIKAYMLQPTGLVGGQAVYEGPFDNPGDLTPLDNIILPQLGLTAGIEVQFLNFMSIELNFQATRGDPIESNFINMAAGAELKFNIKTQYIMIQPYAAFVYPLIQSSSFSETPLFLLGGGVEVSVRGGKLGAFFVNVNYMFTLTDSVLYNTYGPLAPEPPVIHYQHFVIGLGIGYKFGFFNR
ncbi:MAG: hypothetical protein LBI28_14195 [Treponema sp.]|jgi:hypothetical protein|nr:hypothetical protein [Treponema sp.]